MRKWNETTHTTWSHNDSIRWRVELIFLLWLAQYCHLLAHCVCCGIRRNRETKRQYQRKQKSGNFVLNLFFTEADCQQRQNDFLSPISSMLTVWQTFGLVLSWQTFRTCCRGNRKRPIATPTPTPTPTATAYLAASPAKSKGNQAGEIRRNKWFITCDFFHFLTEDAQMRLLQTCK